jgi:hypothetical protein
MQTVRVFPGYCCTAAVHGEEAFEKQSGRRDLNPRPLDPQSSALPSWATSRCARRTPAEPGGLSYLSAAGTFRCQRRHRRSPAGCCPRRGNPRGGNPRGGNPCRGNPCRGNPRWGNPRWGNPRRGNPRGATPSAAIRAGAPPGPWYNSQCPTYPRGIRRGGRTWSPGPRRLNRTFRGPPPAPVRSSTLGFQKSGGVSRSFMGKRPGCLTGRTRSRCSRRKGTGSDEDIVVARFHV